MNVPEVQGRAKLYHKSSKVVKGDRWTDQLGSQIPLGSAVKVITFLPGRRALVDYQGNWFSTVEKGHLNSCIRL